MATLPHHAHEGNSPYVAISTHQQKSLLVDVVDADLANLRWTVASHNYANCSRTVGDVSKGERIHRVVLRRKLGRPIAEGMQADHINGNRLDNRRENLREVTSQQNRFNTGMRVKTSSGYKGVLKHGKKWDAKIIQDKKSFYLGTFDTPEEAATVYDRAALEMFGEYARTNFGVVEVGQSVIRHDWTIRSNNTSGYRGVMQTYGGKWKAQIKYDGKALHLGTFTTSEEAARAYDVAATRQFGEKAKLNFPLNKETHSDR